MAVESVESEGLVSAPGTIQLGGKLYLCAKPTERDVFSVFFYAKKEAKKLFNPFREVIDSLSDLPVTEDQKKELLLQAGRVKSSGEVPYDAISNYLTSPSGAAFYAYVLLRKEQPEVKLEELRKLITEENVLDIFADLDEASGANLIHKTFSDTPFFPLP